MRGDDDVAGFVHGGKPSVPRHDPLGMTWSHRGSLAFRKECLCRARGARRNCKIQMILFTTAYLNLACLDLA
jgi:hypothetical protein